MAEKNEYFTQKLENGTLQISEDVVASVAAAAVLEPEIAPKPAPATAVAIARPPRTRPIQAQTAGNRDKSKPPASAQWVYAKSAMSAME